MTILPKIRTKFGENVGVEIFISPPQLDGKFTFLNTDATTSVSSYMADNGAKFAAGEYIVVGNIGAQKTEINRIHAATAPTSTTITLNAVSIFAHNRGDRIQFIPYNQIIIEKSTDGGTTYTTLATIDIQPDSTETHYNDTTGLSTYYYRAYFSNSATAKISQTSDAVIATGYAEGTAGDIIDQALESLGEKIDDKVLTKKFLLNALDEGRDEIDNHQNIVRWSFRTVFDYDAGTIIPGQYQLTVPTDLRLPDVYLNILSVRIGKGKNELRKVDKIALNSHYQGIAHTTLNGAVLTADTEIALTSSGDFDASGTISVAGQAVGEEINIINYDIAEIEETTMAFVEGGASADTITDSGNGFLTAKFYAGQTIAVSGSTSNDGIYTIDTAIAGTLTLVSTDDLVAENAGANIKITANEANVVSTNILTGISEIRAAGHASGTDVWQGASFGNPIECTVYEDKITFSQPFSNDMDGENIWIDYYKKKVKADSDTDALDEPFYKIYIPYLKYKIKARKNSQIIRESDADWKEWIEKREAQVAKEWIPQKTRLILDLPYF